MATKGWKDFIEDVQKMYDSYDSISSTNDYEEFHKRKGQLDILMWLLSLKEVSEQAYKELQNEEAV